MIFGYHSGLQALAVAKLDDAGAYLVPVAKLKAAGWKVDGMRDSLPRVDASALQMPTAGQTAAVRRR